MHYEGQMTLRMAPSEKSAGCSQRRPMV